MIALCSLLAVTTAAMAQSLNIGDKAPALKVTNWVKGKKQTLGNGKFTVVEFWATWCGPCRMSIPHLTELAHKYKGKVNFVGVSIWEHSPADYTKAVPAFVKDFGKKMDYNVATEGPNQFMAKKWMTAAGENGIPTAFLIDKNGKVAWIGHPMSGLDEAIGQLLSGKLNMQKARQERAKAKAEEAKQMALQEKAAAKLQPVMKAIQNKQWQAAVDASNNIAKTDPDLKPILNQYKLVAMVQGKLPGVGAVMLDAGKDAGDNPMALNQIIWMVVEQDLGLEADAYLTAVNLGEKMMKLSPNDPMNMDTYALALWRSGNKEKALATQQKAVEIAGKSKDVPAETLEEMKGRLKQFGG